MSEPRTIGNPDARETAAADYEAPCVETVLTSDEVEREAHYGGLVSMN